MDVVGFMFVSMALLAAYAGVLVAFHKPTAEKPGLGDVAAVLSCGVLLVVLAAHLVL